MNKYEKILKALKNWLGLLYEEFEDGELDGLVYEIIEIFEGKIKNEKTQR